MQADAMRTGLLAELPATVRKLIVARVRLRSFAAAAPDAALAICRVLAQHLERTAHRDKDFQTLHVDDYPGAASLSGLLPARVARYCPAVALDAGPDRALVGLVDPRDATTRTFINDVLRGRRVEFAAIPQEDFEQFTASHATQEPQPLAESMFVPEVALIDDAGVAQPLGEQRTDELLGSVFHRAMSLGGGLLTEVLMSSQA